MPLSATPAVLPHVEIALPPSRNSTFPVGVPAPGLVTASVAVYLTVPPISTGLTDEAKAVVVAALPITSARAAAVVEVAKLVLPRYLAVIWCMAAAV